LLRVVDASTEVPLFSCTVPVGMPPEAEETFTEKVTGLHADNGWIPGARLTSAGNLTVVTIRLSDAVAVA
jgi:hypothetical protein